MGNKRNYGDGLNGSYMHSSEESVSSVPFRRIIDHLYNGDRF